MKWDVEILYEDETINHTFGLISTTKYTNDDTTISMSLWDTQPDKQIINVMYCKRYGAGEMREPCGEFEYEIKNLRKMSWFLEHVQEVTPDNLKQFIKLHLTQ